MPQQRAVPTLRTLCLQSVAQHMQSFWAKHYTDNYLDEYEFRYIVGPFNDLAYMLLQELLQLLGTSRRLSRAALHLLLLPHLFQLSLRPCPKLANNALGRLIVLRCQALNVLDLWGCDQLSPSVLVNLAKKLPRLNRLGLAHTQANIQVLSAVGSRCRQLRELNVSSCRKVTPRALLHLGYDPLTRTPGCPELRVLLADDLENTEDGDTAAVAFLLLALPRLKVLVHNALLDALRLLHSWQLGGTEDFKGFPSLEELARGRGAAPEGPPLTLPLWQLEYMEDDDGLGSIHTMCPQVEKISVWLMDGAGPSGLRELLRWSSLSRVTLGYSLEHDRLLAEVLPLAQGLGARLHSLTLHGFTWWNPLSLPTLLSSCPNLQSFNAVLQMPLDIHSAPPALPPRCATDLLPRGLHELQSFSLTLSEPAPPADWPGLSSMSSALASVLSVAPQLQTLCLLLMPFRLDSLLQALVGPVLRELRELSLAGSVVSAGTVWQLLGSDGPLRRLNLSRCPDISRRDYNRFLQAVRRQGLDLDIIWEKWQP